MFKRGRHVVSVYVGILLVKCDCLFVYVNVYVCVTERERERERSKGEERRERHTSFFVTAKRGTECNRR